MKNAYGFAMFLLSLMVYSVNSAAVEGPPPPTVSQSPSLNLGATSFYDGFVGKPGLTYLAYLRYDRSTSFRNNDGDRIKSFKNPHLETWSLVHQFSYFTPDNLAEGVSLGFSALIPTVALDADFGAGGAALKHANSGIGDLTAGPFIQLAPITTSEGHPIFIQRFGLNVLIPIGTYDNDKDINIGTNYLTINPHWSVTWFPTSRWEASWRLQYIYNFKNHDPAASYPLIFGGKPVDDSQAGEMVSANFTTSYEIYPKVSVGLNGYYAEQISDDKVNGSKLSGSKEKVLGVGPGVFWHISEGKAVWVNIYHELEAENRDKKDLSIQFRLAYPF